MSLVPSYGDTSIEGTVVRRPGAATQTGCVWCLKENVDSPATFDIVYYWGGTSMCGRHMRITLDQQK